MKRFLLFLVLFMNLSCGHLGYLWDQGRGQLSLQWNGIKNKEVLNDKDVKEVDKEKIRFIIKLKKYFYEYFSKKEESIYSKTVFLKSDAVTYLVISSKEEIIKPISYSFPVAGSFPYLGFFSKKKAQAFKKEQEEKGLSTYLRPVYAYSTLGYFEDRILSSFFHYGELNLSELIFHELFHTIFFIKDEVSFNEGAAEFFSRELVKAYYQDEGEKLTRYLERSKEEREFQKIIKESALKLNELYLQKKEEVSYKNVLNTFLEKTFIPQLNSFCALYKWSPCPSESSWNNAKFAAFLTYEDKQNDLEALYQEKNISLLDFYHFLEKRKNDFKKEKEKNFLSFLKGE